MYQLDFIEMPMPDDSGNANKLFNLILTEGRLIDARNLTPTQILDKLLLQIGRNKKRMTKIIKSNPEVMQKFAQNVKEKDFREVIKRIVENQESNLTQVLETLANSEDTKDAKAFSDALLGWAKFAHGQQPKAEVDITIRQRHELYTSISEEYRMSEAIQDAEVIEESPIMAHIEQAVSSVNPIEAQIGSTDDEYDEFDPDAEQESPEPVRMPIIEDPVKEQMSLFGSGNK